MARIPDDQIERLKREVSLERVAEARGLTLKRHGADRVGLCPFHDDHEPSFMISPEKNLWHCLGACGEGGSVIDFVMKFDKVGFREAVERLQSETAFPLAADPAPAPAPRARENPLPADADDQELLKRVIGFYHRTLQQNPEGWAYLEARGLADRELVEHFQLGLADRTLGMRLPAKQTKSGADLRGRLQALGVLRESGHEHFNGSLVVPVFDAAGNVVEVYGRKVTRDTKLRKGTPLHLYLPGPHQGIFNREALAASKEIILCEALIDALTFWRYGYRNVTSSFGVNGFTQELLQAFRDHGTERVLIAYDRDEAGNKAAAELAELLIAEGIEVFRILFPKGMDANQYALSVTPAAKSLGLVIRKAEWMGKGKPPARECVSVPETTPAAPAPAAPAAPAPAAPTAPAPVAPTAPAPAAPTAPAPAAPAAPAPVAPAVPAPVAPTVSAPVAPTVPAPAAPTAPAPAAPMVPAPVAATEPAKAVLPPPPVIPSLAASFAPETPPLPASPVPEHKPLAIDAEVTEREVPVAFGPRRYRVRGLSRNSRFEQMRVNLLVSNGEAFHVDTLDLYSAKPRQSFIQQAAIELGERDEVIKSDLAKVLLKLEELQEAPAAPPAETAPAALSEPDQAAALALLRDPQLIDRVVSDLGRCGLVGEETNKLACYLACLSRKLERPLAVVVQSTSAAGKSSLMDAVLALVPEEERVQYAAMTGQSLYYLGETDLKHKILAIAEEEGAHQASYALKLLQSEGELTIASTGKSEATGELVTKSYRVEGPVMLCLTTTAIEIDEELLNRCLVLSVDEAREQTREIHAAQRRRRTLAGLLQRKEKEQLLQLHRNAQRLLRPLAVVNPYAEQLTFLDDKTRTRRDHEKYLTLIDTIALLHQHQRPIKSVTHGGELIEYVEVTAADIALANRLAHEILGRTLDELPPQTRRLLQLIRVMVAEACAAEGVEQRDHRFSRKTIRDFTGWSDSQLKIHCQRLESLEYLLVHSGSRGKPLQYELLYDGAADPERLHLDGLIAVEALERDYDAEKSGVNGEKSGPSQGQVSPKSGASQAGKNGCSPGKIQALCDLAEEHGENAVITAPMVGVASYPEVR